jgi:cytosine/adenosine deaminase-related metal-dependent hydrolase
VGQAYLQAGLRAFLSPMVSDRPYQATLPISEGDLPGELLEDFNRGANTTEQAVGLCREVATLWKRGELRGFSGVHLGPSGPQRCSDALLVCLHQMAVEMDLGVHTHLLETRIQRDTAHAFYGQNMLLHLEDLGILSDRWSFAHGVWLAEPEALRLGGKRGVTVVHNPVSNLFLASGIAPVKRLIEAGINVALGTDGANCAGNQSMFEAMKMAACLGKVRERDPDMWLTGTEVFTMATRTGAGMLGVPAGDIEAGQKADLVLMEERPWCVPESHIVNQVVYSAGAGDVSAVVAGGRVLMEEGTLLTIDEKETYAMALEALRSVLSRNKEAFRQAERYSGELMRVYRRLAHLGERR